MAENNKKLSLATAGFSFYPGNTSTMEPNPWIGIVDLLTSKEHRDYRNIIRDCRFFFRHDPLASTVIGKMVDLAITDLVINTEGATRLSQQEQDVFNAISNDLYDFIRKAAFEYLLTGLLVPEIKLTRVNQEFLRKKRISRLSSLLYPTEMWLRDSKDIEIKRPPIGNEESYFVIMPEDVLSFIRNKGHYDDGGEDKELYRKIATLYPKFVEQILEGETKIRLENPLIIKSTSLADSQYPIPYLYSALEALKHKRNLRRMDYSIAARVISAILHGKLGSDEFPLTEDQSDEVDKIESKFKWRDNLAQDDIERVFLLVTNHTVDLQWIFPDVKALLDNNKYETVNQDILVALGFPRILITGETERSFASDPQIATLSPVHTMDRLRRALLPIINTVYFELAKNNESINNVPVIEFKPINLMSMQLFFEGIKGLYETGNLSREDYSKAYGYILDEQLDKREHEDEKFKARSLQPFQPVPHSNEPGRPSGGNAPENSAGGSSA